MRIAMKPWFAVIGLPLALAAQTPPPAACEFDGFSANPALGVTVNRSVAYYGCGAGSRCLSMKLKPQQPVVIFGKSGDWICGYAQDEHGAAPVWVQAQQVSEIRPDPNPPATGWLGMWSNGDNRIEMKPTSDPLRLALTGHATWHGSAGAENSGEIEGDVTPSGNHIHYAEGADACSIDLTLFGKYLVANDNELCGGRNVRFWGIWTRARK